MRRALFIISMLMALTSVEAQDPVPELLDTVWYLHYIYDSDLDEYFYVEGYQPYGGNPTIPQISPQVRISSDLGFEGDGICNYFTGELEYDSIVNSFRTTEVFVTAFSCGFFEDMDEPYIIGPFGYVDPDPELFTIVDPQVSNDPDGFQTMQFITQPFLRYTYRNTAVLARNDLIPKEVKIYPNPVQTTLIIDTKTAGPFELTLSNIFGQQLLRSTFKSGLTRLDLKGYISGVYLLTLSSSQGSTAFRILKK
jgi:hypothetical protein